MVYNIKLHVLWYTISCSRMQVKNECVFKKFSQLSVLPQDIEQLPFGIIIIAITAVLIFALITGSVIGSLLRMG
ncbi:hypothetical protein HKBW3S42_00696 [Candidatus Hakubella thermalkaliphila]|uniref:Uncharacterized protein n=1 Tax=Candidatus Hakubella thermalkaliphila TaxID=2754717 RepID=A0A6V8PND1_9ACTN|nr:hypothetical protein HKBW3S42_00696 [Candidatus Hakubella thermalkaliphila]